MGAECGFAVSSKAPPQASRPRRSWGGRWAFRPALGGSLHFATSLRPPAVDGIAEVSALSALRAAFGCLSRSLIGRSAPFVVLEPGVGCSRCRCRVRRSRKPLRTLAPLGPSASCHASGLRNGSAPRPPAPASWRSVGSALRVAVHCCGGDGRHPPFDLFRPFSGRRPEVWLFCGRSVRNARSLPIQAPRERRAPKQ